MALTFGAGLVSIASPCVLPVVPILVTGTAQDHPARPLALIGGLSFSFILMGIITSLFGAALAGSFSWIERISGLLLVAFGVLMLLDINIFKNIALLQRLPPRTGGLWSGFTIGASLGLIWIPCIGPMLSSVLAMVAARGSLPSGVLLLAIYSLGFAIPMLIAGYATQFFRLKSGILRAHPRIVQIISSVVLIVFGLYIATKSLLPLHF